MCYCSNKHRTDYCRHTGVVPKKCLEKQKLTASGCYIYGGQEFSLSWFVVLCLVRTIITSHRASTEHLLTFRIKHHFASHSQASLHSCGHT